MFYFQAFALPRWLRTVLRAVCWALPCLLLAVPAHGAGNLIPEDTICARLGQPAGCGWTYEPGKALRGTVSITVLDDGTREPGTAPVVPLRAAVLQFAIRGGPTVSWISQANRGEPWDQLGWFLMTAPCLEMGCSGSYAGPSEVDLVDSLVTSAALRLQVPDPAVVTALQVLAGADGLPVVERVGTRTTLYDGTGSSLPTTRTHDVRVRFAVR